jgi:O-antigen/teichoic acid export membrane protein
MAKSAFVFLGIDGFIAIWGSINLVLLSKLGGTADIGLFNAATQVLAPVVLIYQGIIASIFPIMCRKFESNSATLRPIAEYLTEFLLVIAVPTAVALYFLADSVALILYGNREFLLATGALQVLVWTLITTALTHVFGQILIASLRESVTLRIVIMNTLVNLILGVILIYQFGLIGAAITSLFVAIINLAQHYLPLSELLPLRQLMKLAWKPIVASCCMTFAFIAESSQGGLFTIVPATFIYCSALFGLAIWSSGGMDQLKLRYLYGWSQEHS